MKGKTVIFLSIAAVVVILDQVTKWLVTANLALHQSVTIIKGFLDLVHVRNTGVAFGMLSSSDIPYRTIFFLFISLVAMAVIVMFLNKLRANQTGWIVGLGLVFGGAWGNLIDRVRMGGVTDFIDVHVSYHHWPAFNVADSAVTIGALLLVLQIVRQK